MTEADDARRARDLYRDMRAKVLERLANQRQFRAELNGAKRAHPLIQNMDAAIARDERALAMCDVQIELCEAVIAEKPVDHINRLTIASGEARQQHLRACASAQEPAERYRVYVVDLFQRSRSRPRLPRLPKRSPASAPTIGCRDQIRRRSPGEKRGPPPPCIEAPDIAAALVAPLARLIATTQSEAPSWAELELERAVMARPMARRER